MTLFFLYSNLFKTVYGPDIMLVYGPDNIVFPFSENDSL